MARVKKLTSKEQAWLIDIFQDDLPVRQPDSGLILAESLEAAVARARRAFPQWETWRILVRKAES